MPKVAADIEEKTLTELGLIGLESDNIIRLDMENFDDQLEQDRYVLKPLADGSLIYASATAEGSGVAGKTSARQSSKHHRKKRSQYYEAEVHSSEATVDSFELPSARLERS